ncbi:tetraacyldisaccharide 4'-kinase [Polaribacter irgensii 23-P]|uniref:Tetraacyldisaccharide 4'-kinase n=1 Tax=Polaribacter irgensii 23-P TaxID=313594 RepID=A4BYV6_9FLAO|nr:tetraacyldisaccharide 4'-kinase [Polaribacter irgensii]EAR12349.1 tetraacyldisaccharide 4'-kinase [Polaribacter irgensii 23-P]
MKVFRFLLFPLAILYDFVTRVRNLFFDTGVFKRTAFDIPILIVGNLSLGGTGKTPQIEYLVRMLQEKYAVSILSRGYKRNTKGFILVNEGHSAQDVGDEPLQYYKKFKKIHVAVDANRVAGITKLMHSVKPEVLLLDDAFQHRKVQGSCVILLTKWDALFVDDYLVPSGNLRESQYGANRADIIVVTKCPKDLSLRQQEVIRLKLSSFQKRIFFTSISYASAILGSKAMSTSALKDFNVLLITGIANPIPLSAYLESLAVKFDHLKYGDHHHFSEKDIRSIQTKFNAMEAPKMILTTEKDYVRLVDVLAEISYLPIETSFLNKEGQAFEEYITPYLK